MEKITLKQKSNLPLFLGMIFLGLFLMAFSVIKDFTINHSTYPFLLGSLIPICINPFPSNNKKIKDLFNFRGYAAMIIIIYIPVLVLLNIKAHVFIFTIGIFLLILGLYTCTYHLLLRKTQNFVDFDDELLTFSSNEAILKLKWTEIEDVVIYKLNSIPHIALIPKDSSVLSNQYNLLEKLNQLTYKRQFLNINCSLFDKKSTDVQILIKAAFERNKKE